MRTLAIGDLKKNLESLGIPSSESQQIFDYISLHQSDLEKWMAVATGIRPHYFDEARFHASELIYLMARDHFKKSERLFGNFGVLYYFWNRLNDAKFWFNESIELNPKYYNSQYHLASCYEHQEEFEKAEKQYRKAILINGNEEHSWNGLGNCLWELGRKEEAIEAHKKSLQINPGFTDPLFNLAVRYAKLGNFPLAEASIAELRRQQPNDDQARILQEFIKKKGLPLINHSSTEILPSARFISFQIIPDIAIWPTKELLNATLEQASLRPNPLLNDHPQIFIAYKSEGKELDSWIEKFSRDLIDRGYLVAYDKAFGLRGGGEIIGVPLMLEQLHKSSYFVSIITDDFRKSVEFTTAKDRTALPLLEKGTAILNEWVAALNLASMGRIKLLGIWKSGLAVPAPFNNSSVVDGRDDGDYQKILDCFPILDGKKGGFVKFEEPTTFSEKGLYITRSGGMAMISTKLELNDLLFAREKAYSAIVQKIKSAKI